MATWTDTVVREVLPNGLTVLVQRDPHCPVVAVVTHVRAGYFDEPDEWVGIAHVLEHMFFKGTPSRGPGELARRTQRLGGYLNAATIYDKTVYYAVVPPADDGLLRAMALQADALQHASLDPGELTRELEVIVQEAKRKLDNPAAVVGETLYELLFSVHRMRRWRIGTEAGLRRLTADDLRSYYETRYTPGRVIVALTGSLDPERALDHARRLYGAWRRDEHVIAGSPDEPVGGRAAMRVMRGDVQRPLAVIGWRGVGPLHADAAALDVAAAVLGLGRGSRLQRAVRRTGLASAVSSDHYTPADVGIFEIGLTSDGERIARAAGRSLGVAAGLGAPSGLRTHELERVRALLVTEWARRLETADGRGTLLAEFEALGGVHLADRYFRDLQAVECDDVGRVAGEYLVPARACATFFLPEDGDGAPATWPIATSPALGTGRPVAWRSSARPADAGPGDDVGFGVRAVRATGADLLARRRGGTGLVVVAAYFPGARLEETERDAGISWLLARTALRGAAGLDADQLALAAESLGGPVHPVVGAETLGWVMAVRADAAAEAGALLRAVAAEPILDEQQLAIERELQADDAARVRDDMFRFPLLEALRAALPGHPYTLPALGEPDRVRALEVRAVRDWAARLRRTRPVVVAVGDLEPVRLLDAVAAFGDWPSERSGAPPLPHRAWVPARGMEQREKEQSALALAFPGPTGVSDQRYAASVMAALLSGLGGRLFDELRERRALAYAVHASPWLRRTAGAMLAYVATSPEREDEARDAMLHELGRLAGEPVPDEELERARRYAAGLVEIGRQRAHGLTAEIAEAWILGAMDEVPAAADRLRAVRAEDLMALAGASFDAGRRAEFVVRGRAGGLPG